MTPEESDETEYTEQTEPGYKERSCYWKTAIGLQQVDGLTPSRYLIDAANANIEGKITLDEAERLIEEYYTAQRNNAAAQYASGEDRETRPQTRSPSEARFTERSEEADKVALHIAQILSANAFKLTPVELLSVHRRLFDGVFSFAGQIRDCNITKREWVLNDDTVVYADYRDVRAAIEYDIEKEKAFDYSGLDERETVRHIAGFISDLWQIHAFREGNTRAVAVFAIKYLRTFGYDVTNDTFEKNALYFRNALVRANYNNRQAGVTATPVYLNRFFGNLLLGENNELRNRELHINWVAPQQ